METHTAFIGLGSNLEDPAAQVRKARDELAAAAGTQTSACSSLYRSAAVGYVNQPDFINAVMRMQTTLNPHELLELVQAIEQRHGRTRDFTNAPRTLDLDILLYDELTVHDADLIIPHPRMHDRAFVLVPLTELAPQCVIPGRGVAKDLLRGIDASTVTCIGAPKISNLRSA